MDFAGIIVGWYRLNKRALPWRETRDPYKIWLSEVILQQTRVQQGLSYYEAFVKKYPTVKALAAAPEDEVLKLWQGLGYYSRARNLHAAAKHVATAQKGTFPPDYQGLRKLKGVGDYTASAIASICYGEAQPVVDGNVYRVLSRIFGISTPIDSTTGKKEFRELAAQLIPEKDPASFNQAIMEFGAMQCVPKSPDCGKCVFVQYCEARKKNLVATLPVKAKKTKVTDRYFYYLVIRHKDEVFIRQRSGKDIWQGLHDFPLIEAKETLTEKKLVMSPEWKAVFGKNSPKIKVISPEVKHVLSHQRLYARFVEVETGKKPAKGEWFGVKEKQLGKYAVPVLIEKYLEGR